MPHKPAAMYRAVLQHAWAAAWKRKPLWVFGMFAAILSSGGVGDVAYRSFRRMEQGSNVLESILSGTFAGTETFGRYVKQIQEIDQTRILLTLAVVVLLGIALIVASAHSQGALIAGLSPRMDTGMQKAVKKSRPFFWNILTLNALQKAAIGLMLLVTSLPLVLALTEPTAINTATFFLIFLLFFPLTVVVSIVFMLALMDTVEKRRSVVEALHQAWKTFSRHWLAALELGFILFFLTLIAGLAVIAVQILLVIPYTFLFNLAVLSGSALIFNLVFFLGFLMNAVIFLSYTGLAITFQYASWLEFYKRTNGIKTAIPVIAKLNRLFHYL